MEIFLDEYFNEKSLFLNIVHFDVFLLLILPVFWFFMALFNTMMWSVHSLLLSLCLFSSHAFFLSLNLHKFKLLIFFFAPWKFVSINRKKNRMKKRMDLHVLQAGWTIFIVFSKWWSENMGVKRSFQWTIFQQQLSISWAVLDLLFFFHLVFYLCLQSQPSSCSCFIFLWYSNAKCRLIDNEHCSFGFHCWHIQN